MMFYTVSNFSRFIRTIYYTGCPKKPTLFDESEHNSLLSKYFRFQKCMNIFRFWYLSVSSPLHILRDILIWRQRVIHSMRQFLDYRFYWSSDAVHLYNYFVAKKYQTDEYWRFLYFTVNVFTLFISIISIISSHF